MAPRTSAGGEWNREGTKAEPHGLTVRQREQSGFLIEREPSLGTLENAVRSRPTAAESRGTGVDITRGAGKVAREDKPMLWTLIVLLLVFWLLGFAFNVAGGIVHVLLVIALVLFVVNLLSGRRTVV
jgi:hypothetical protein